MYTTPSPPPFFETINPSENWKFLIFKSHKMGSFCPSKDWQLTIPGKIRQGDGFQILIPCFVHLVLCHWFSIVWNN
jgi:hypothetical protein